MATKTPLAEYAGTFRVMASGDTIPAAIVPTLNQNTTGSAATLTTARTITIGSTGKTFNGSANVSWTLAEIGAAAASHTHNFTQISGGSESQSLLPGSTALTPITGATGVHVAVKLYSNDDNDSFAVLSSSTSDTTSEPDQIAFRVKRNGDAYLGAAQNAIWHGGNFDPTTKVGVSGTETITGQKTFSQAIYANAADAQLGFYGGDNTNSTNRNIGVIHNKSSGNLGIYDARVSAWLLRIDSSNNIYMPSGNKPVESDGGDVLRIRKMTAAAYAALGTKDANTLYVIT